MSVPTSLAIASAGLAVAAVLFPSVAFGKTAPRRVPANFWLLVLFFARFTYSAFTEAPPTRDPVRAFAWAVALAAWLLAAIRRTVEVKTRPA